MRYVLGVGAVLLSMALWASGARAAGPYLQVGAGVFSRDVVEEDPSIVGFTVRGDAVSTRVMIRAGVELRDLVNLYAQVGAADLSIDEFNNYDADLDGAYEAGLRLYLYRSPYRDRSTLYAEFSALWFETDDHVQTEIDGSPEVVHETIQWNEYTVRLGASSQYEGFRPYGGIRLSWVNGTDKIRSPDFSADLDLKEDDNFGIFGGVDIFLDRSEKTALNFEVSLLDQDSFQVALRREF